MGYTYPGTTKSTSFTSTTSPALKSWGNKGIDLPITEITETADGYISFNVQGGKIDIGTPLAPEVEAIDNGTINIKWQAVEKVTEYLLNIYTKDAMGNKSVFEQYTDYSVGNVTEHAVEGVSGNTTYYVTVTGANGRNRSEASPETVVTTPELKFIYTTPVALDGSSTDDNEVTLNWLPLDGAVKYLLTIEAEVIEGEETIKVDFGSNDTLVLPEGWVWSGAETDIYKSTSTGDYGEASPALKFASSGLSLTSPVMRGNISKVSFWLRGASANSSSSFSVDGRYGNDDKWLTLYSIISLATMNSKGDVLEFEPTAGNIRQLRFIYTKSSGNAALDDVSLTIPAAVYKPLDEHNRTDVGNITEYTTLIDGTPTRIRFYVEAQNAAGETSRRSNIVTIDLKQADGVSDVLAMPASVTTYGNTVAVNAEANTPVQIYNISGTTVAQTTTDAEGKASFTLPAGFYIVATQSAATKVIVK